MKVRSRISWVNYLGDAGVRFIPRGAVGQVLAVDRAGNLTVRWDTIFATLPDPDTGGLVGRDLVGYEEGRVIHDTVELVEEFVMPEGAWIMPSMTSSGPKGRS